MRIVKFLFLPLLSATFASAQVGQGVSPSFEHDRLSCMSTEHFPVVEARLEPAEQGALRKAQVYFKAGQTDVWYFVEMEPGEQSRFQATLPRPLVETERVDYYLFFLSSTFEPSQSQEFSVNVSEAGCSPIRVVATSSPTALTLGATIANQTPVPPGFSAQGISGLVTTAGNTVPVASVAAGGGGAASSGISGVTVGALAGGGAAAAAAVVVASGSGDDTTADSAITSPDVVQESGGGPPPASPVPSPPPSPTPTPSPPTSATDISGTWILDDLVTASCEPSLLGRTSRTAMVITQTGMALTATHNGPNFTENLSGTIDAAGNLSMSGPFVDEAETGQSNWEASTSSGSKMNGHYTRFYPAHSCTIRWRFSGSKS